MNYTLYFPIHPENFMQKCHLDQKLLTILFFCLFIRNCQLFFNSTGGSASERRQKSLKIWIKFFWIFGIVDKVSDCDAKGPGFESCHRRRFKVSRLNKRRNGPFCSRVHKSLNFKISTKNVLLNFITQWYLNIQDNSKLIDFFGNYFNSIIAEWKETETTKS